MKYNNHYNTFEFEIFGTVLQFSHRESAWYIGEGDGMLPIGKTEDAVAIAYMIAQEQASKRQEEEYNKSQHNVPKMPLLDINRFYK